MSTYDYACTACGAIHEETHSMNAKPNIICNVCGNACEKHITATAVHFKGLGWSEGNNPHEKVDRLNGRKRKVKNA